MTVPAGFDSVSRSDGGESQPDGSSFGFEGSVGVAPLVLFKERYSEFYFFAAPFNEEFLAASTYLIIGRRGTGKTSLARFLSFQTHIRNARHLS